MLGCQTVHNMSYNVHKTSYYVWSKQHIKISVPCVLAGFKVVISVKIKLIQWWLQGAKLLAQHEYASSM